MRIPSQVGRMAWLATHLPSLEGSGIIYALTTRDAALVAEWLQTCGIDARAYTGAMESGDREQLEDIRNKLRTRIFQQEGSSGVNDLLTNETYQKDKAMLELLNIRIKEMLGEDIKKLRDKMDQLSEAKKGTRPPKTKITAKGSKPDFLDMDKDGDKKEPMKKAIKDKDVKEGWDDMVNKVKSDHAAEKNSTTGKFNKKKTTTGTQYTRKSSTFDNGTEDKPKNDKPKNKKVGEGKAHPADCECNECMGTMEGLKGKQGKLDVDHDGKLEKSDFAKLRARKKVKESVNAFKHNVRFVNESIGYLLQEDEEGKAKTITAAGDMVNDFTSWMQRVGQYQTKAIIELSDEIRAEFGPAEAEAFKQAVAPALAATIDTLTTQREVLSHAVAVLAGEATPADAMGMEPGMDQGMPPADGMDMSAPDEMNPDMGDEFAGADAAAGGPETSGRAMRESKFARKLAESHSIMSKLAK
jgi:hypothetical protein